MSISKKYKNLVSKATTQKRLFYINLFVLPLFVTLIPDLVNGNIGEMFPKALGVTLLSYLFFLLFHLALTLITNSIAASSLALCVLSLAAGFSNENKIVYRDEPVFLGDLYHLGGMGETLESGLSMKFGAAFFICVAVSVIVFILYLPIKQQIRIVKDEKKKPLRTMLRLAVGAVSIVAIGLLVRFGFYNEDFTSALGRRTEVSIVKEFGENGYWFGLISTTETLFPTKPAGYNRESLEEEARAIEELKPEAEGARQADVIIVQVETLFDLGNYDVSVNYDPFAPLDELKNNGFYGNMISPKYGGGTAYVEYEVLTGFSSGYSQASACPYNAVIYDGFPGAPRFFLEKGYSTAALHSYNSLFYNRVNAYPQMGFEKVYFDDCFVNPKMSGEWISDEECVNKTIEIYKELSKQNKNGVFLHVVTMQNHSPVYPERYTPSLLMGASSDTLTPAQTEAVSAYARAFEDSCDAVRLLADYLATVDRDVVLLVYGDHQASIYVEGSEHEILRETGYLDRYVDERDFKELHDTPYLVWANFPLDTSKGFGDVPPNMLLVNALRSCGVMRPAYFDYFDNILSETKGATANYTVENDGSVSFGELSEEQKTELLKKKLLEYDLVYGKKYLKDVC